MSEPTVSIVIAAYDAEATVGRCVRSILAQTEPDLEVIVVDDGSTDRTREIVLEIAGAEDDGRVVVAPAAPNAGPSVARNRGFELSRGRWLGYLDADDEFSPEFIARMVGAAERAPAADVVMCAHRVVQVDGEYRDRPHAVPVGDLTGEDAVVATLGSDLSHYVWDKLFRRELLDSDSFPAGIHRGEDLPVVLAACGRARRVRVLDEALVRYYVSPTSLTWGRVAPIDESERLVTEIRDLVDGLSTRLRMRRALALAEAVIYLNAAHQAIAVLPADRATEFCRESAARIPWRVALGAVRARPTEGLAKLLFKALPSVYRRAYRAYVAKNYGISE